MSGFALTSPRPDWYAPVDWDYRLTTAWPFGSAAPPTREAMLSDIVEIDGAPVTPRERNTTMQVQDCMRVPAVTCGPETKLVEVARQMEWEEIGFLVVLDGDDRILGIITDRDLVNAMARDLPTSSAAREVMASRVMTIHEHEDVYDAAAKMAAARCRRLPVVNAAGKLVGVVAIDDMVSAFSHRTEARSATR